MRRFARLVQDLDETLSDPIKVDALVGYFREVASSDASWAVHLLFGGKLKRIVPAGTLKRGVGELASYPEWMVAACCDAVGDLAEVLHLLAPPAVGQCDLSLANLMEDTLLPLAGKAPGMQVTKVQQLWREVDGWERLVVNQILTGGLRIGIGKGLIVKALAEVVEVSEPVMWYRLAGFDPLVRGAWNGVTAEGSPRDAVAQPYPFFLSSGFSGALEKLGQRNEWQIEWKWEGVRTQLIKRRGEAILWSRGEALLTELFPEIIAAAEVLPDGTVLDGDILVWREDGPAPRHQLERRLVRTLSDEQLVADLPAVLMVYDVLEQAGTDLRTRPLLDRREQLETLLDASQRGLERLCHGGQVMVQGDLFPEEGSQSGGRPLAIQRSAVLEACDWSGVGGLRMQARERSAGGLMMKRLSSVYGDGRCQGDWWKWKVDPYTLDAVLIGVQPEQKGKKRQFTDYTFGVWSGGELVPIARTISGFKKEEIVELDRFVKDHITGRHGPLRSVEPRMVFKLAFDGVSESARHRSGLALRCPRILRWERNAVASDAAQLESVRALLLR